MVHRAVLALRGRRRRTAGHAAPLGLSKPPSLSSMVRLACFAATYRYDPMMVRRSFYEITSTTTRRVNETFAIAPAVRNHVLLRIPLFAVGVS